MAHKINKKYNDSDNSRQAFRWRQKHGLETKADRERKETKENVDHGSKMRALIESGEIKTSIRRKGNQVNLRKH